MSDFDDATRFEPASGGGGGGGGQLPPGAILNHTYRIERFIARGGMGDVYSAVHVELGTRHAIKTIQAELISNQKVVDLFRREAAVLRNLRHAAVVGYDGVMRDENGVVYLTMEFVEGPSLSEVLRAGPLSVADLLVLRDRIGGGLAAAHDIGIIHRDISPDNIILPEGRPQNAKMIDFGIAKVQDPEQATILGDDFAGKYAYASPEQLGLFGGKVDHRSDIYSLGLLLAAAAIGRPLAMGDNPMSVLEARKTLPDLSEAPSALLDDLVKMLQPDPDKRLDTLVPAAQVTSVPPPPQPPAPEATAPQPRKKGGMGLVVLLVALLAAAGGAGWVLLGQKLLDKDDADQIAVAPGADPAAVGDATDPLATDPANAGSSPPAVQDDLKSAGDEPVPPLPEDSAVLQGDGALGPVEGDEAPAVEDAAIRIPEVEISPNLPVEEQIRLQMLSADCAQVNGQFDEATGRLVLGGHVPDDYEREILRDLLLQIEGVNEVNDSELEVLPPPACAIFDLMAGHGFVLSKDHLGMDIGIGEYAQLGTVGFNKGDKFKIEHLEGTGSYDAYFYVDYFNPEGGVVHIMPGPVHRKNKLKPDAKVVLGGVPRYTLDEPYSTDLLLVIGVSEPLFDGRRDEAESAQEYLRELDEALARVSQKPGVRGEYSYVFIKTWP